MHIYHYAAYEKTALRRLMSRHGTREEEVDHLLRNEVLVDLYRVVRQGIRLSTDSYSLKKVERLYMPAREESIADAAGSMVMYERWLTSRDDGGDGDVSLLDEIALYNERDCVSTVQLRDWLEGRRVEEERLRGAPIERPPKIERDVKDTLHAKIVATQEVAAATGGRCALGPGAADCGGTSPALLAPLLSYHRRENKVNWWRHFDQIAMSPEELERDTYALGPLEMIGTHEDGKRTIERYRFEPQEHRIGIGDSPLDPEADLAWAPVVGRGHGTRLGARRDHPVAHAASGGARRRPLPDPVDADHDRGAGGIAPRSRAMGGRTRRGCTRSQPCGARPPDAFTAHA